MVEQGWTEGFATAAHVVVEFDEARCEIRTAGHPPTVHYRAGSGLWEKVETRGPMLGVVEDPTYHAAERRLEPGDALVVYTDGVVESARRPLDEGVDRLLGVAEALPRDGFAGGARLLVDQAGAVTDDDRSLVLLWRS